MEKTDYYIYNLVYTQNNEQYLFIHFVPDIDNKLLSLWWMNSEILTPTVMF